MVEKPVVGKEYCLLEIHVPRTDKERIAAILVSDVCPFYEYIGECIEVEYDAFTFPHHRYLFLCNGSIYRYDDFYYMDFRESEVEGAYLLK